MSEPQHMSALQRANYVRIARRRVCAAVRALPRPEGEALVAEILRDHALEIESERSDVMAGQAVIEMFGWIRRRTEAYGYRLARATDLHRLSNHYGLQLRQLTAHEAFALADALSPTTVTNQEPR